MKNKTLDKIKKLLRLANSSNPNEAALALSRAQKLMAELSIGIDDPQLNGVCDASIVSRFKAENPARHVVYLIKTICKAFGCQSYVEVGHECVCVVFVGHDERPEIASYVYSVLERQLTKARREYITSLRASMLRKNKTNRANYYCEGWVIGVSNKVKAFACSDEEIKQIELYMSKEELSDAKVRKPKGNGCAVNFARRQGFDDSKNVSINHGVSGEESKKLWSIL